MYMPKFADVFGYMSPKGVGDVHSGLERNMYIHHAWSLPHDEMIQTPD